MVVHWSGHKSPLKKVSYKVGGGKGDKGRKGVFFVFLLVTIGGFALYPLGGGIEILEDISFSIGAMNCSSMSKLEA